MGCLSDFTENVEPFTDLVKFIIENEQEVFKVLIFVFTITELKFTYNIK